MEGAGRVFFRKPSPPPPILSLLGLGVQHVHGAAKSRVVGADHAPDVDGAVDLGNGNADERLFNGPALPGVVARRTVPHGGGYNG